MLKGAFGCEDTREGAFGGSERRGCCGGARGCCGGSDRERSGQMRSKIVKEVTNGKGETKNEKNEKGGGRGRGGGGRERGGGGGGRGGGGGGRGRRVSEQEREDRGKREEGKEGKLVMGEGGGQTQMSSNDSHKHDLEEVIVTSPRETRMEEGEEECVESAGEVVQQSLLQK